MEQPEKLRFSPLAVPIHVVLVEPEIPPNTGAIARTCVATGTPLHLVGELGFDLSEHRVRRAGLDYWPKLTLHRHETFEACEAAIPRSRMVLFSANADRGFLDFDPSPGDALVFGRESVGLPRGLIEAHRPNVVAIPTTGEVRSLNLSNAVAIAVYDWLRRLDAFR
ncbi:MAG: tRNA (cytidine(34)-2'-O)-methyltransferase [Sandaracinaceae bacterium]